MQSIRVRLLGGIGRVIQLRIGLHNIVKFNNRTARVIVWVTSRVYISMAEVYPKSTDMSRAV